MVALLLAAGEGHSVNLRRWIIRFSSRQAADAFRAFRDEVRVARTHRRGCRAIRELNGQTHLSLNFGCGGNLLKGFVNIDYAPQADYRLDLRQPIPLGDAIADRIFSEHFMEHLDYPERAERFLRDCFRMLGESGEMLISVPDTEWPVRDYKNPQGNYAEMCRKMLWHPPECETDMEHINYHFRQRPRGRSSFHFECHRFAYDFDTMEKLLHRVGFVEVALRDFDPSLDSERRRVGSLRIRAIKAHGNSAT